MLLYDSVTLLYCMVYIIAKDFEKMYPNKAIDKYESYLC